MANPQQVSYPIGIGLGIIPQDWMFKYFPNHTRDKVTEIIRFILQKTLIFDANVAIF